MSFRRGLQSILTSNTFLQSSGCYIQHFELCHKVWESNAYMFPSLITTPLDAQVWKPEPQFVAYVGRNLSCADETDAFPPGFFPQLQVQATSGFKQEKVFLFKSSFIVDAGSHQCLVQINDSSTAIRIVGRAVAGEGHQCIQLLNMVQTMVAHLIRLACPSIFLDLQIFSSQILQLTGPIPTSILCTISFQLIPMAKLSSILLRKHQNLL